MGKLLLGTAVAVMLALPVRAETPEQSIMASLEAQGYHLVVRDRTWLGRIWMIVESDDLRREIVFNPGTGEILRDYAVMLAQAEPTDRKTQRTSTGVAAALSTEARNDDGAEAGVEDGVTSMGVIMADPVMIYPSEGQ
jgi:hypothetical protein